jgi:hypothetical protein
MENEAENTQSSVEESSSEIEKPKVKRTKKDRSPAQIESFNKAKEKRAENVKKRELEKLEKYAKLKKEVKFDNKVDEVVPKRSKPKKRVVVVQESSESETESDSSIEVVVKRKPKGKKPTKKKEDDDADGYDTPPDRRLTPQQLIAWL